MSKKPYLIVLSLLFVMVCMQITALGQPVDPQSGGDPDVPITGIEILLGIGGLLGARKAYLLKKRNNQY